VYVGLRMRTKIHKHGGTTLLQELKELAFVRRELVSGTKNGKNFANGLWKNSADREESVVEGSR
jgi:hypothetical protein